MGYGYGWTPYVPVEQKLAIADIALLQLVKEGLVVQPIKEFRGKVTKTFWGNQWVRHIESFQAAVDRLERGRTYVRNGSVRHLEIESGKVSALVAGSVPYIVNIEVKKLKSARWNAIKQKVVGQIDSLFDLLQGKISEDVLAQLADENDGLFPKLNELSFTCTCPDAIGMNDWVCKHIAAVFYGIGRRFETNPELLFTLRGVDSNELIAAGTKAELERHIDANVPSLEKDELENIFGIELAPREEKTEYKTKNESKTSETKIAKKPEKTVSRKKTPGKAKPNKTASLSITITEPDRKKLQRAVDKSGLSRSAFIVARLEESFKKVSDLKTPTPKLKRSKRIAKKDVQIVIRLLPSEKKQVHRRAKQAKKSMSQFVYDVLFE